MLTTRLSDVMTGCGGNDTTCSRRSTLARGRSTNGTRKGRPGSGGGGERPSRSMITALAWGTTRTALAMVDTTKSTSTARTMSAMMPLSIPGRSLLARDGALRWDRAAEYGVGVVGGDDGGGAVDAHDLDVAADLERVPAGRGAGAPHLAADLDPAVVTADGDEHLALGADEGGGAGRRLRSGALQVPQQGRAGGQQEQTGRGGEHDEFDGERGAEGGGDRGGDGAAGDHEKDEVERQHLDGAGEQRSGEPEQPRVLAEVHHRLPARQLTPILTRHLPGGENRPLVSPDEGGPPNGSRCWCPRAGGGGGRSACRRSERRPAGGRRRPGPAAAAARG